MKPVLALLALAVCCAACTNEVRLPGKKESCTNGLDDDGDGKVDCLDPDCFGDAICQVVFEVCGNTIDDDRTGLRRHARLPGARGV
jgi:hypothetical protein